MHIDTLPQYSKLPSNHISACTVIVVDVLRASTSIIWAVKNGAKQIVPTADAGEAASVVNRLGLNDCVLAGERGGEKLAGFDIGNSPAEFNQERVYGKTVVISTTNGTVAIHGMNSAKTLLIGGMINRTAVAKKAIELGNDVLIVCAGTDGTVSADDICAAGAIADAIINNSSEPCFVTDFTRVSISLYKDFLDDRFDLASTYHYSRLLSLGFTEDPVFCFQEDITDVIPVYENGIITRCR
ncbi:MAG: 2-phosphosulfolactate phosphatase [Clostridia bacterium]|nr:2-phosphosulfolactate phosphatase [Clostridia bacterium]